MKKQKINLITKELSRIANSLEKTNSKKNNKANFNLNSAFVWETPSLSFRPVKNINSIEIELLKGIDSQKDILMKNTESFSKGFHGNNVLLWGAKGTGKSSLVKSAFSKINFKNKFLKLIEIHREDLESLPKLLHKLVESKFRFIIFCDDLSFNEKDTSFKSLKAVLEGGIEGKPENVLFYATSNRRHLMPRTMNENIEHNSINPSENLNENVSLSDRFGVWIGFHNLSQETYLEIIDNYVNYFELNNSKIDIHKSALSWSVQRGARSGRVAWQYIVFLASQLEIKLSFKKQNNFQG